MGSTRNMLVASVLALVGCAADQDAFPIDDEAPDAGVDVVADRGRDAATTGPTPDVFDASVREAAAPDALPSPDAPAPLDALPSPDAPAPPDGAPVDAPTCPLPPPTARPPAAAPDGAQVPRDVAAEHPDWLLGSCVSMGGNHSFLFEVLRRLRLRDPRWGLDRSGGAILGDVVAYFYGDGCPEGRGEVYKIDIIARLCAVPGVHEPPAATWIDRSAEGGVWTLTGFDGTPPDAGAAPDATAARPPLPDGSGVVRAVAAERPELLRASCVTMGGNNEFLFEVVRRLRRIDTRWGLNWKRGNVGDMSQDVVDYYYGAAGRPMEGSTETYIVDIIGSHCGATPSAAWTDVTDVTVMSGTIGRWTLAGRSDLGP